ncbi:hypothetical protein ACIA5G_45425 [Amycolatopsis sp. NPDC051758]|uniref:hypothetical protein n=1 Tax=Amycolatopsis sp. NPDC051758 TaxID=3363935 RepID=UPI0037AD721D
MTGSPDSQLHRGVIVVTHHYPRGPNLFAGLGSGERQGTGTVEANRRVNPVFVDPSGHRRLLVRGSAGVLAVAGVAFIAGTGLLLANQPATSASGDVGSNSAPVGLAPGAAQQQPAAGAGEKQVPGAGRNSGPQIAIPANVLPLSAAAGGTAPGGPQPAAGVQVGTSGPAAAVNPQPGNPAAAGQAPVDRADPVQPAQPVAVVPPAAVVPPVVVPPPVPAVVAPVVPVVEPVIEVVGGVVAPVTGAVGSLLGNLL